jgi:hypothetical protein
MVNLEKWEEISFYDIKVGDKIKAVYSYRDGSYTIRTGVITALGGTMKSAANEIVFSKGYCDVAGVTSRIIYRRKRSTKVKIPTRHGASLKAVRGYCGSKEILIHADVDSAYPWWSVEGQQWLSVTDIKDDYKDIEVLSKGIKIA